MAKYRSIKNSLLGGEISPAAFGRTDLPIYNHACKTLRNMIPMTSGGAYRRPGTIFATSLAESTYLAPKIIPFPTADGEVYSIALTKQISGQKAAYATISRLSSTAPNTTVVTTTSFALDEDIDTTSVSVATDLQFLDAAVSVLDNTITINNWAYPDGAMLRLTTTGTLPGGLSASTRYYTRDTSGTTVKLSLTNGGGVVDITSAAGGGTHTVTVLDSYWDTALSSNSLLSDEISEIQHIQVGDVVVFAHKNTPPVSIKKRSTDSFSGSRYDVGITNTAFIPGAAMTCVPFQESVLAATNTITPSATTGRITLTAVDPIFAASSIGTYYKLRHAGNYGMAMVTGFTSTTVVSAIVVDAFGADTPSDEYWEAAWSNRRGYPTSVGFFQGRLVYGGTASFPDSLWFSGLNDYNTLSVDSDSDPSSPALNDSPFTLTFASTQINKISWMSTGKSLVVGTAAGEWVVDVERSQDATNGFGGLNASATKQSDYGSISQQVSRSGDELFFSSGGGNFIRALVFNDTENAYVGEPTQTLFSEFPKRPFTGYRNAGKRFRCTAWDESRSTLWACDLSGNLFSLTRDRRLGMNVWATHQLGGYDSSVAGSGVSAYGSTTTDPIYYSPTGSVTSVAVVPNPTSSYHDVWLCVRRKINNAWQYHVERFTGGPPSSDTAQRLVDDEFYLDSTIYKASTGGAATYTWTGFDHLEGKTVSGVASSANGLFTCSATAAVSSGSLTLATTYPPNYATINYMVSFGLSFDSIVEPVRLEAGSVIGTAQGAIKRSHKAIVRFYKTLSAKVGRDASNLETLVFREGSTPLNESPDYFTGDKIVLLDSDYDRDGLIYILQDQPLPFSVVAIVMEGMTYD